MELQCSLAAIDLNEIMHPSGGLEALYDELAQEDRPAHIMDSLWFVHAINGAAFKLFEVDPEASYMNDWRAWHVVGSKFWPAHPVRQKHHRVEEFFPQTIDILFKYENTYPYLFSWQMRNLIKRLHDTSEENGLEFTRWWQQATSFNLSYSMDTSTRTIMYDKQPIQVETRIRALADHLDTSYTLTVWEALGEAASDAFKKIQHEAGSKDIYYAKKYDRNNDFHVNTWPEVKPAIEQWQRNGSC